MEESQAMTLKQQLEARIQTLERLSYADKGYDASEQDALTDAERDSKERRGKPDVAANHAVGQIGQRGVWK